MRACGQGARTGAALVYLTQHSNEPNTNRSYRSLAETDSASKAISIIKGGSIGL